MNGDHSPDARFSGKASTSEPNGGNRTSFQIPAATGQDISDAATQTHPVGSNESLTNIAGVSAVGVTSAHVQNTRGRQQESVDQLLCDSDRANPTTNSDRSTDTPDCGSSHRELDSTSAKEGNGSRYVQDVGTSCSSVGSRHSERSEDIFRADTVAGEGRRILMDLDRLEFGQPDKHSPLNAETPDDKVDELLEPKAASCSVPGLPTDRGEATVKIEKSRVETIYASPSVLPAGLCPLDSSAGSGPSGSSLALASGELLVSRRKLKRNLNKLTVERFPVIAEEISRILLEDDVKPSDAEEVGAEERQRLHAEAKLKLGIDLITETAFFDHSELYPDLILVLKYKDFDVNAALSARLQHEYEILPRNLEEGEELIAYFASSPSVLLQCDEDELRSKAKQKIIGLHTLIGHLFIRKIIGLKLLSDIISDQLERPDPCSDYVECICKLVMTVGGVLEASPKGSLLLDLIQARLAQLQQTSGKRIGFLIHDLDDARRRRWSRKRPKIPYVPYEEAQSLAEPSQGSHSSMDGEDFFSLKNSTEHRTLMIPGSDYAIYVTKQEEMWQARLAGVDFH